MFMFCVTNCVNNSNLYRHDDGIIHYWGGVGGCIIVAYELMQLIITPIKTKWNKIFNSSCIVLSAF